jgi:hypothetical protein
MSAAPIKQKHSSSNLHAVPGDTTHLENHMGGLAGHDYMFHVVSPFAFLPSAFPESGDEHRVAVERSRPF